MQISKNDCCPLFVSGNFKFLMALSRPGIGVGTLSLGPFCNKSLDITKNLPLGPDATNLAKLDLTQCPPHAALPGGTKSRGH